MEQHRQRGAVAGDLGGGAPGSRIGHVDRAAGVVDVPAVERVGEHESRVAQRPPDRVRSAPGGGLPTEVDDEVGDDGVCPAGAHEVDEQHGDGDGDGDVVGPQQLRVGAANSARRPNAATPRTPANVHAANSAGTPARRAVPVVRANWPRATTATTIDRAMVAASLRPSGSTVGQHVGGADRDGRRPPAEATGRVRHVQVHERAAMQVGEPAPQSAGEPCPASDAEDQPDRAGAAPLPSDRCGGEDHEPDDAVGDTQRRRVGRIGGDPLRHRGDRAGGDQGGDERLGAHRDHPTRAARAGPVSWLLGMNPRAADWRSRRR